MKKRLCLHDAQGKFYLTLTEIVRLEASDNYTVFFMLDGKKHTQSGSLNSYFARIKEEGCFLRIHRSHAINLIYVSRIDNSGMVVMMDGSKLPINEKVRPVIDDSIPSC
jgi:two-component system LytT family response regulator